MTIRKVFFILPLLALFSSPLTAQWEKVAWEGYSVSVRDQVDGVLLNYLGADNLYKSFDDGKTWIHACSGIEKSFYAYDGPIIPSSDKSYFYVYTELSTDSYGNPLTRYGAYRSKPRDTTWEFIPLPRFDSIGIIRLVSISDDSLCLLLCPSATTPKILQARLFVSPDRGKQWIERTVDSSHIILDGFLTNSGSRLILAPLFNRTLTTWSQYLNGIYTSSDFGQSWHSSNVGLPDSSDVQLYKLNDFLFFSTGGTYNKPDHSIYLYVSRDGCNSWSLIDTSQFLGTGSLTIRNLTKRGDRIAVIVFRAPDSSDNHQTVPYIYISEDDGISWQRSAIPDSVVWGLFYDGSGIFSLSDGFLFEVFNNKLDYSTPHRYDSLLSKELPFETGTVRGGFIKLALCSDHTLLAFPNRSADSLFISTNDGISWDYHPFPGNWSVLSDSKKSVNNSFYFLGTDENNSMCFFISSNLGSSWQKSSLLPFNKYYQSCFDIEGNDLFVEVKYDPRNPSLFYSSDLGNTWMEISRPDTIFNEQSPQVKICSGVLYMLTNGGNIIYASSDRGKSWYRSDRGLPDPFWVRFKGFESVGDKVFVYSLNDNLDGNSSVYVTSDSGKHWSFVETGMTKETTLLSSKSDNGYIYLSSSSINYLASGLYFDGICKIFFSSDSGRNWCLLTDSLPWAEEVFVGSDYIYFSGAAGLYRFPKALASVRTGEPKYETSISITSAYPNPARDEMRIEYSIPKQANVKLTVYDMTGKQMEVLADEAENAGIYEIKWDTRTIAAGTYILELSALGEKVSRRVEVVK